MGAETGPKELQGNCWGDQTILGDSCAAVEVYQSISDCTHKMNDVYGM